jgi:L-amino acid N-acyltransferase YncA
MNIVKTLMFVLPMETNVGGSVYVPPTWRPRPAYNAARSAVYVERTGSARTNGLAGMRPASSLAQNSLIWEVS